MTPQDDITYQLVYLKYEMQKEQTETASIKLISEMIDTVLQTVNNKNFYGSLATDDLERFVHSLEKMTEKNHFQQAFLGFCYLKRIGVLLSQSEGKMENYFKESLRLKSDFVFALHNLGCYYRKEFSFTGTDGPIRDCISTYEAERLLQQSYAAGYLPSKIELAHCLYGVSYPYEVGALMGYAMSSKNPLKLEKEQQEFDQQMSVELKNIRETELENVQKLSEKMTLIHETVSCLPDALLGTVYHYLGWRFQQIEPKDKCAGKTTNRNKFG